MRSSFRFSYLFLVLPLAQALVPYPSQWETSESNFLRTVESGGFELVTNITFLLDGARKRMQNWFRLPDDFTEYPVNPDQRTLKPLTALHVHVDHPDNVTLIHGVDESYNLTIPEIGCATLYSSTVFGALRGLATFAQLLQYGWIAATKGSAIFTISTPHVIQDAPLYSYRGLLVDTSRHFLPMELLLTNLDAMEMNKLNVLHWHMTDSPSWPYQSVAYPELSAKGAYRGKDNMVYSPDAIRKLVREAHLRGIRVVVEMDLPGHSRSLGASHPEWMAHCPDWQEPINPTRADVLDFIAQLYENELPELFPSDMVHLGGDEVPLDCWKNDSSIQDWMKKNGVSDEVHLFELFETMLVDKVIRVLGKRPIVWQEIFDLGINISQDVVIDVWKDWNNQDTYTLGNATERGFDVILSSCWYLDHLNNDWKDFYKCDPRAKFNGTKEQMSRVLGGHASMWGERVDPSNFMSRVWPRASSVAERLWTTSAGIAQTTIEDRMTDFRCKMVQRGIDAGPIGPGVCPKEPRFINNMVSQAEVLKEELAPWTEYMWGGFKWLRGYWML